MIINPSLLSQRLVDFTNQTIALHQKDGVIIDFDGTLMSVVNLKIVEQISKVYKNKVISIYFAENKQLQTRLKQVANQLGSDNIEIFLDFDLNILSPYQSKLSYEVSRKRRLKDIALNYHKDENNFLVIQNSCYSQWITNFPNESYKNRDCVYLLNSLLYSEVQQLARYFNIDEKIVNQIPSHNLYIGQTDSGLMKFSYQELEDFLRRQTIENQIDSVIQSYIGNDNMINFTCPKFSRPSQILSKI